MTVDEWLEAHGGPRRFEQGAVGDLDHLKVWLLHKGWEVSSNKVILTVKRVGAKGRPQNWTRKRLYALVDEIRVSEGLEPLRVFENEISAT